MDDVIGNVTTALKTKNMYEDTVSDEEMQN